MATTAPRRFQRRFLGRVLPALAAANLAVSFGYGAVTYWAEREQILKKQERAMPALAASASEPLWSLRYEAVTQLLEGIAADPDVLWAAIRDDGGHEVATIGSPNRDSEARSLSQPVILVREHLSEPVGTLLMQVSLRRAWTEAGDRITAGMAIALASTLALLAGVFVAAQSLVARPLAAIQEGMRRSRHDGRLHRIAMTGAGEELDNVVVGFNALQARIEADGLERAALASRLDAALTHMAQGITMYSASGTLLVVNTRCEDLLGIPRGSLRVGMESREVLQVVTEHCKLTAGEAGPSVAEGLALVQRRSATRSVQELPDGRILSVCHEHTPDGGWVTTYEDVTDRRRSEEKAAFLARHDALTGLPNRSAFGERLDAAVAGLSRGRHFALLCLDLDRFKEVNDTLGHASGDALLRAVSERLQSCVRESDVVARLGGDEFAILQAAPSGSESSSVLSRRLVEVVGAPYEIDGHHVVIGVSVGIALAPGDGSVGGTLLRNADLALYRAKGDGRGTFRYFEAAMDAHLQQRRRTEADLRLGVARREFEVHYQPLVSAQTRQVVGMEALLRWQHPERGLVPADEFIPLAEETGLIVEIGRWVLRQACCDATTWPEGVRLAVNVSPVQFRRPGLIAAVSEALSEAGLAPDRLELEITETVLLHDTQATLATLNAVRELGVRIAMDDFGTGYSSLSYLRQFPFDKIKIDRSFVREVANQAEASAIVRAVAALGSSLGISTTAEGVETLDQLGRIQSDGCTEAQGYLFSRPRPASEIRALIKHLNAGGAPLNGSVEGVPPLSVPA